ncbi:hypothetical protein HELRODRAFT_89180 [Helobdella robusta]|uniref:C2H2-type domain-containing protein n=1 Tax=Helobdella robusta TaxID=6412 RepID=T1G797_HELRO|nr:hypothetical protein HELRODRAFT_89180 [Helobdella robusta]ESN93264.1 hypothetical protein HELRODRAFT_89180 [Helobdella robusta]
MDQNTGNERIYSKTNSTIPSPLGVEEKIQKCQRCMKTFPTAQQLLQHSLVHSNVRKYPCQYCEKTFKQLSHVQQHLRIHTGINCHINIFICIYHLT